MTTNNKLESSVSPEIQLLDTLLVSKNLDSLEKFFAIYPDIDASQTTINGESMWYRLITDTIQNAPQLSFQFNNTPDDSERYKGLSKHLWRSLGNPLLLSSKTNHGARSSPLNFSHVPQEVTQSASWKILTYQLTHQFTNPTQSIYPHLFDIAISENNAQPLLESWLKLYSYSPLFSALKCNDLDLMTKLISMGFEANKPIYHGQRYMKDKMQDIVSSPISLCSSPESLAILLSAGADPATNIYLDSLTHPVEAWSQRLTKREDFLTPSKKDKMSVALSNHWTHPDDKITLLLNSMSCGKSSINKFITKFGVETAFQYKTQKDEYPCAFSNFLAIDYTRRKPNFDPASKLIDHLIQNKELLKKTPSGETWLCHIVKYIHFPSMDRDSIRNFIDQLSLSPEWNSTFLLSDDGRRKIADSITQNQLNAFKEVFTNLDPSRKHSFFTHQDSWHSLFDLPKEVANLKIDGVSIKETLFDFYTQSLEHEIDSKITKNMGWLSEFKTFNTLFLAERQFIVDNNEHDLEPYINNLSPKIQKALFFYFLQNQNHFTNSSARSVHLLGSAFVQLAKSVDLNHNHVSFFVESTKRLPPSLYSELEKIFLSKQLQVKSKSNPSRSL